MRIFDAIEHDEKSRRFGLSDDIFAVQRIHFRSIAENTLMAGAILTENIFSWPGVGSWLVTSIYQRDYPSVQGGVLLIAGFVILVNLSVDLIYGLLNPRIRGRR